MKSNNEFHYRGHYFLFHFDTNTLNLNKAFISPFQDNPNIIKHGLFKSGDTYAGEVLDTKACDILQPTQNCVFGELTDRKWRVKRNWRFRMKSRPEFMMNRLSLYRKDEVNLSSKNFGANLGGKKP